MNPKRETMKLVDSAEINKIIYQKSILIYVWKILVVGTFLH